MTIEFAEKEIQMTYTHTKRLSTWIIITELGSKQWWNTVSQEYGWQRSKGVTPNSIGLAVENQALPVWAGE